MGAGSFDGKVGVIVGAAGGIGAATARAFASGGAHVILLDVDADAGERVRADVAGGGSSVEFHCCDVADSADVAATFASLAERHVRLDFAANLVGGSGPADDRALELHEQAEQGWDATLALTLRSTLVCMKHELAVMVGRGGGAIVNVASMAGLHVTTNATPAYSAAKAGVLQLTRHAAVTYGDRGIRVNAVAPGLTATPKAVAALGLAAIEAEVARNQPIPRAAHPLDQAAAIVWLCTDQAAMVTGHTLPIDGGWNAR